MLPRFAAAAMGTRFEVVVDDEDLARARSAAEAAFERVHECDARLSAFRTDSLVARANRGAFERPVALDAETFELLERCLAFARATHGAFDVAAGGWMRARGLHAELETVDARPGAGFALDRATRSVRFRTPDTRLDLGAIGKGEALRRAADALRDAGVERALLHGGTSSVLALGGWRVALGPGPDAAVVELADASLSVSSTSARAQGGRGHLVDPRDGAALAVGRACAVIAPSPLAAEAWSTALLVLDARGAFEARHTPAHEAASYAAASQHAASHAAALNHTELLDALAADGASARFADETGADAPRFLGDPAPFFSDVPALHAR